MGLLEIPWWGLRFEVYWGENTRIDTLPCSDQSPSQFPLWSPVTLHWSRKTFCLRSEGTRPTPSHQAGWSTGALNKTLWRPPASVTTTKARLDWPSGLLVTMPAPRGRKSFPTKDWRTLLLPALWLPTTAIWGSWRPKATPALVKVSWSLLIIRISSSVIFALGDLSPFTQITGGLTLMSVLFKRHCQCNWYLSYINPTDADMTHWSGLCFLTQIFPGPLSGYKFFLQEIHSTNNSFKYEWLILPYCGDDGTRFIFIPGVFRVCK